MRPLMHKFAHAKIIYVECYRYGKSYDELNSSEKQSVGGTKGGRTRAEGAGSEGMADMGKQGGNVTKDDTGSSW